MADSLRHQIVSAVATRLATITTANGYRTNAGENVSSWRVATLSNEELPALVVRDLADEVDVTTSGTSRVHRDLTIQVGIFVKEGSEAVAESARHIIADIQEAIGTDEQWGGLAQRTMYRDDELVVEQNERKLSMALARFDVRYAHGRWNPDATA